MNRHEESSSGGLALAIVIGLLLCLFIAVGAGVGGVWFLRRMAMEEAAERRLIMEHDVALARIAQQQATAEALEKMQADVAAARESVPMETLTIEINGDGKYLVSGEELSPDELREFLSAMRMGAGTDVTVTLNFDSRAKLQDLQGCVDLCRELKISVRKVVDQ